MIIIKKFRRIFIAWLMSNTYNQRPCRETLIADVARWGVSDSIELLFLSTPEFRSVFFYRVGMSTISARILKLLCPPRSTLYITTVDIGTGLFIQHGFATIVAAKKIGRNCWINQQVTIGFSNAVDSPTIGDDVTVNAGALIIGGVSIGDRVKVGAGAVVVKSVPADCTVVGNPARIVRRNGLRVTENL